MKSNKTKNEMKYNKIRMKPIPYVEGEQQILKKTWTTWDI